MGELATHLHNWPESARLLAAFETYDRPIFTMPGVKFTKTLQDKMANAFLRLKGASAERPLVQADISGLKSLIKYGHLKAALNLSTKLLTDIGQGHGMAGRPSKNSLLSFEIWAIRFQVFMALKMHSELLDELTPFGELDAPDVFLQYYTEHASQKGSIVPYSLRLVHAEAFLYSDEPSMAFPRIQRLEENTNAVLSIMQNSDCALAWRKRLETVELLKARLLYKLNRYGSAFNAYETLAKNSSDETKRCEILAFMVRLALLIGNSTRLNHYIECLAASNPPAEQLAIYECFKSIFYGNYELAENSLRELSTSNRLLMHKNNEAISLFYNGKVEESLNMLLRHDESLIEPTGINLATIAELTTTSSNELLKNYFLGHCDNVNDVFNPQLIKIDS